MGRLSHRKGKAFEQELCHLFSPAFPNMHTRRAGGETGDAVPGRDFLETANLCIQAKCRAHHDTWADMKQLIAAARYREWHNSEELPVLVMRRTGQADQKPGRSRPVPDLVVVPADSFIPLIIAMQLLDIAQQEELARRMGFVLEDDPVEGEPMKN